MRLWRKYRAHNVRISSYMFFQILFRSHFTCEYRLPLVANIEPLCGISIAPLAQISIYLNIPSSTVAATTVPLLHKDCSFSRNRAKVGIGVDSRRDGGPPDSFVTLSACHLSRYRKSLPHKARQSRAGEGRCGITACYTFLVPRTEKGCRDGQQVGECRWARTFPYVTEAEPTRSPYMRPYTRSVPRAESEKN